MIVVGAYSNSLEMEDHVESPLAFLANQFEKILPSEIGLHLLPFYPNSGDSGFAPDDWFEVQHDLGTWSDIQKLAQQRKLIVDCIYNHVGVGHRFAKRFFDSPNDHYKRIHAYQSDSALSCPRSPRGGPVLRNHLIKGQKWQVWQTFSESAIDIQLDNVEVQEEIDKHLNFLSNQGIWGVRLDGPAYFGKQLGIESHRHHLDSYRLTREIANKALMRGFTVNAQLDCDEAGLKYFPKELGLDIPIVDYSYSAYLIHALLTENTNSFSSHVKRMVNFPQSIIFCPRTHDGILLRSKNLDTSVIRKLLQLASKYGLKVREIDGSPYEFNYSLPYLCSLGVSKIEDVMKKVELIIAVTGFLPGWSYMYLPFLSGYIPELSHPLTSELDPRIMNRQSIPVSQQKAVFDSPPYSSIYALLTWLGELHKESIHEAKESFIVHSSKVLRDGLLSMQRENSRIQLLANFSHSRSVKVLNLTNGKWFMGRGSSQQIIEPLGFGFWRY